jgi:hypothetical protein
MATRVYNLVLNYNSGGQFCSNVLHLQFDDSGFATTQDAAQALITAWLLANKAALVAMLPTDVTLLSVRSRLVNGVGGFEGFSLVASGNVGTRTGTQSATGLSPCVILYPVSNGRKRGRIFLPGVSEADCVDGIFAAAFQTAISTNMLTLLTSITLVGGGTPSAAPVIYDRVNRVGVLLGGAELSPMLGTQRRRMLPV